MDIMKPIYSNTSTIPNGSTITATIQVNSYKYELVLEGTVGKYVLFVISCYNWSDNKMIIQEMTQSKITIPLDFTWYHTLNYYNYIYNISGRDKAECYSKALAPASIFQSNMHIVLSINKTYNLYSTYVSGAYCVYNPNDTAYYIDDIGKIGAKCAVKTYCSMPRKVTDDIIRMPKTSFNDLRYDELTPDEKKTMVPSSVNISNRISLKQAYNWVPAKDLAVTTTLTYVQTNDKEFHFMDDGGKTYKYNIDTLRTFIHRLVKGKLTGSFIYKPTGNKAITYTLQPIDGDISNDIFKICESDDSDQE
jgi:hypothetical protein